MDEEIIILYIVLFVFQIACMWIVYNKADKPGWGVIIPIYNVILLCDIAGQSRWWTVGIFIPIVSIFVYLMMCFGVAKSFRRSLLFGFGLFLLPIIFYAILAFGHSYYHSQLRIKYG